ncbi:hypothetical protein C1X05_03840 [Laceyella sacchari]|uniref:DUF3888 domain-containing protein n=1 Tax=Laceyella tengchongensis TaxID=574699 RepID=A0AA45WJ29_9BACL|nr:DUF3888 domain-containing protein [Laceyella tengchongensis]AUS08040.1 hypothetical protein C1X05_03840 [Laceyella sacchari]SMP02016.1 Protein of unknown function [Laceyella tengchongensis]
MKQKRLILGTIVCLCFLSLGTPSFASPRNPSIEALKETLLVTFYPSISNAIAGYYGDLFHQFRTDDAKILSIRETNQGRIVVVQVRTFVGSHNPPYGLETITLRVNSFGIYVEKFQHKNV